MPRNRLEIKTVFKAVDEATQPIRRMARQLNKSLKPVLRSTSKVAKSMAKIGAMGATGAAGGIALITKSFADQIDVLRRYEGQLGISTELLQELGAVGGRVGMELDEVGDFIADSLAKIADARDAKSGALWGWLEDAGGPRAMEEFQKVSRKSADEQIKWVLKTGAAIKKSTDRLYYFDEVASDAGKRFSAIFKDGPEKFQEVREEAHRLGLVLDEDVYKRSVKARLAQLKLNASLAGLRNAIGSKVLPAIQPYVESLAEWVSANRELIGQKVGDLVKGVASALERVDWDLIKEAVSGAMEAIGEGFSSAAEGIPKLLDDLGDIRSHLQDIRDVAVKAANAVGYLFNFKGSPWDADQNYVIRQDEMTGKVRTALERERGKQDRVKALPLQKRLLWPLFHPNGEAPPAPVRLPDPRHLKSAPHATLGGLQAQGTSRVEGTIKVEIDQSGQVQRTTSKSRTPGVTLPIGTRRTVGVTP